MFRVEFYSGFDILGSNEDLANYNQDLQSVSIFRIKIPKQNHDAILNVGPWHFARRLRPLTPTRICSPRPGPRRSGWLGGRTVYAPDIRGRMNERLAKTVLANLIKQETSQRYELSYRPSKDSGSMRKGYTVKVYYYDHVLFMYTKYIHCTELNH